MQDSKIVLVTMATRLEDLLTRFNTQTQAQFYVEHLGADFSDYLTEHKIYHKALETCRQSLGQNGRLQVLAREYLPNYIFGPEDVVVTLGRDGLVANTLKYLDHQPLLGVNPDSQRWDGVLLSFTPENLLEGLASLNSSTPPVKEVSMAQATLNDGRTLLAVNDFFIGTKSHVSSRYQLTLGDRKEFQSSSGIIVSTGLGSSGWLKSVVAGAQGIMDVLDPGKKLTSKTGKAPKPQSLSIPWNADYLYFTVREPFPSRSTATNLVFGKIEKSTILSVLSQMPEKGVIFSDGIEQDFLEFTAGTLAQIGLAPRKGRLVQSL